MHIIVVQGVLIVVQGVRHPGLVELRRKDVVWQRGVPARAWEEKSQAEQAKESHQLGLGSQRYSQLRWSIHLHLMAKIKTSHHRWRRRRRRRNAAKFIETKSADPPGMAWRYFQHCQIFNIVKDSVNIVNIFNIVNDPPGRHCARLGQQQGRWQGLEGDSKESQQQDGHSLPLAVGHHHFVCGVCDSCAMMILMMIIMSMKMMMMMLIIMAGYGWRWW